MESVATAGDLKAYRTRRQLAGRIVATVVACISVVFIAYPPIGRWVSQTQQDAAVAQYGYAQDQTDNRRMESILQSAREYNAELLQGGIADPYGDDAEHWLENPDDASRYERELTLQDTDVMSWLSVPSVKIVVPIYHGTSESVLKKGAGHLLGSSLPVGGSSTRAIITAHSGLPRARLFSGLSNVSVGDTVTVSTMGEDLFYRIIETKVIVPTDVEGLGVLPGRDLVTLITCTPSGLNTHRLVVTAERVPSPLDNDKEIDTQMAPGSFPWWVLLLFGAPFVVNRMAVPKSISRNESARMPPQHRRDRR